MTNFYEGQRVALCEYNKGVKKPIQKGTCKTWDINNPRIRWCFYDENGEEGYAFQDDGELYAGTPMFKNDRVKPILRVQSTGEACHLVTQGIN